MIAALWAFRTPIAIGLAVVVLLGALWGYGHHRYNQGYEVGHKEAIAAKAQLQLERDKWQVEVKIWQEQVKKQQDALDAAKKEKEEIVKQNLENFFKQKTIIDKARSKREVEISKNIKPTDTIIVPSIFERVYNNTVKGSYIATGDKGNLQVSENRSSTLGETKTFDAFAFTQVVIKNVEQYNSLALQCGKLIDTVVQLEKTYGANLEGSEGSTVANGGNIFDGATRDQLF